MKISINNLAGKRQNNDDWNKFNYNIFFVRQLLLYFANDVYKTAVDKIDLKLTIARFGYIPTQNVCIKKMKKKWMENSSIGCRVQMTTSHILNFHL